MKKLLICLLLLVFALPLSAFASQEQDYTHLYDQTGTFSQEEQKSLESEMDALWRDLRVDAMIVTTNNSQGKAPERFAADFYESRRKNYTDIEDSAIFAFCFDIGARGAYGEATHGRARSILSAQGEDALYNVLSPYLPSRSYGDAMHAYLRYVRGHLTPRTAMQITQSYFPFVLLFAFIVALITVFAMKGQMKLAKNKYDASPYMARSSLHLTDSQDIYLYETERRVRIESNSSGRSSGGGGRSFSSGSGRSYGGRSGSL